MTSIDNVSTDNDYPEGLKTLEKTHPKLGRLMRRLYPWRVLYGFLGFILGIVKWIVELVIETHN